MHSAAQCSKGRHDCGTIYALAADHDEPRLALLAGMPRPVEMLLQPSADRLHDLPALAARQVDKTLDPQHVVQADRGSQSNKKRVPVLDGPSGHDKALEIIVIVPSFELVHRGAGSKILLGGGGQAERHLWRHPTVAGADELDPRTKLRLDLMAKRRQPLRGDQFGLVKDHEIGAG